MITICKNSEWLQCAHWSSTNAVSWQYTHCQRMRKDIEFTKRFVNKIQTETYFHMMAEYMMKWVMWWLSATILFPNCDSSLIVINEQINPDCIFKSKSIISTFKHWFIYMISFFCQSKSSSCKLRKRGMSDKR